MSVNDVKWPNGAKWTATTAEQALQAAMVADNIVDAVPLGDAGIVYYTTGKTFFIGVDLAAPAKEPQEKVRPPLTWAQSKPFDPFPGFVVNQGANPNPNDCHFGSLPSPDLQPTSHLVSPGFGSAYLKGKA